MVVQDHVFSNAAERHRGKFERADGAFSRGSRCMRSWRRTRGHDMTTTRTTYQTVTFTRPFSLSGLDGAQPAGAYTVETDDELLQTLSFPAHRRLETRI